jgi:hypothetical protein
MLPSVEVATQGSARRVALASFQSLFDDLEQVPTLEYGLSRVGYEVERIEHGRRGHDDTGSEINRRAYGGRGFRIWTGGR